MAPSGMLAGAAPFLQCFDGVVTLTPAPGLGAVLGILATAGFALPLRQVPGPALQGVPLASAGGQFVRVCGHLTGEQGQVILNVISVNPLFQR